LALCAFGVHPKMRPGVYGCRQPKTESHSTLVSTSDRLRRGRADSAEGVVARIGKVAHSTEDANPLGWHAHGRKARGQADHEELAHIVG
jgi:hypothetical protein